PPHGSMRALGFRRRRTDAQSRPTRPVVGSDMSGSVSDDFLTLHEFIQAARINLNQNIWDYLVGGTETETTLRRNRQALDSVAFRPRVLCDVSKIDSSASFFGHKVRLPVALAPVGSLESFESGGGATAASGA